MAAKESSKKQNIVVRQRVKKNITRKGRHSKKKSSSLKTSKVYKKAYRGQGK